MQQVYHSNTRTNINVRQQIQSNFSSTNEELAVQFCTSPQTISKWRNRDFSIDASCVPKNIAYSLNGIEAALAVSLRSATWLPLDEVFETLLSQNPAITRRAIY